MLSFDSTLLLGLSGRIVGGGEHGGEEQKDVGRVQKVRAQRECD